MDNCINISHLLRIVNKNVVNNYSIFIFLIMSAFLRALYMLCVIAVLCLPSIAVTVHLIVEDHLICSGTYTDSGMNIVLVKGLIYQMTFIAILLGGMVGYGADSAQSLGAIVCLVNFVTCMLFWNMCERCQKDNKCSRSKEWIITLGFMNILLPLILVLQNQLEKAGVSTQAVPLTMDEYAM